MTQNKDLINLTSAAFGLARNQYVWGLEKKIWICSHELPSFMKNRGQKKCLDKALRKAIWCCGVVVITMAQLHSTKPEVGSAQDQILFAVCWKFEMVSISDNGPSWK